MTHGYTTDGPWFIDPLGRHTLLRGVNLGGSSKVPMRPPGATGPAIDRTGRAAVSFVGRPAPLDELDEHLDRIAHWGFNVLRLLTTWEAIEHAGPGEHDEAYLEYFTEVVRRAGRRGLLVFVDPHQDVWSRFTGGDGAPYWCFELAGLRPERFEAAGAAVLDDFDWPANNRRPAAATMWSLFFAGDHLLPELAGVREELQSRYLAAVGAIAERLVDVDHVLGYDSLNEPSGGYLAASRIMHEGRRFMARGDEVDEPFTPLEHLAAADGVTVARASGRVLNPNGVSIWRDGCPWRRRGVWDLNGAGTPTLLAPQLLDEIDGRPASVWHDGMVPFVRRFRDVVRRIHPGAFVFIEGEPLAPDLAWDDPDPLVVNARHWYDIMTLMTRRFDPTAYRSLGGATLSGAEAIGADFTAQLAGFARHSAEHMSDRPLLLGEFGIPYEMNDGEAYRTGDWTAQEVALEANYRALDATFVHSTQWNYTADNSHAEGDRWNHEDLSIFSPDDRAEPSPGLERADDSGGRGVDGFCRPHLLHAAGRPRSMAFDPAAGRFELDVELDPAVAGPTEVYVPIRHFPGGPVVDVEVGEVSFHAESQRLSWHHPGAAGPARLVARREE